MSKKVAPIAVRAERLKAEMQIPIDSEKKSALSATTAIRPNSPGVTPPISSGTASIGTTASTP